MQREREGEGFHQLFDHQSDHNRPGLSQAKARRFIWVSHVGTLGSFSAASPRSSAGTWMENRAAGMQTRTHMAGQLCRWQLYSLWHRVDHTEWGLGKQQVLVEPLLDAWLLWFPSSGLPGSCACCKPEDPQRRSTFLCSLTSLFVSRVSWLYLHHWGFDFSQHHE